MRLESLLASATVDFSPPTANIATNHKNTFKSKTQGSNGGQSLRSFSRGGNPHSCGRGGRGCDGRGNPRPVCQICGKLGHLAPRCYSGFDHTIQGPNTASSSQNNTVPQAFVVTASTVNDPSWYVDSGATAHVTADLANLSLSSDYKGKEKLTVGNGNSLPISHVGYAVLDNDAHPLYLTNVLRVPLEIIKNLISVSKFTYDNDLIVEFFSDCLLIKDKRTRQVLLKGTLKDGLYQFTGINIQRAVSGADCSKVAFNKSAQRQSFASTTDNKTVYSCSVEEFPTCNQ